MMPSTGTAILVIALIFASEACFLSEARHFKICQQCAFQGDKKIKITEARLSVISHVRELMVVATVEDSRPSTPGHSPGVGNKPFSSEVGLRT